MVERLAIVGLGLIGGSLAAALKKRPSPVTLVAYGRDPDKLAPALASGLVDEVASNMAEAAAGADLIVVCTPVGSIAEVMQSLRGHISPGAVVTDVGSTKQSVIAAVASVYGRCPDWFVPAHPVAGKESSGFAHADAELFVGRKVALTPLDHTRKTAVQTVTRLWQSVGAEVEIMAPDRHDRILALSSHFPHLLSFAFVAGLGETEDLDEILRFAAGGFRDFSRLAGSDAVLWRDICLANREPLLDALHRYQQQLSTLQSMLETGASEQLQELFGRAREIRKRRFGNDAA